MKKIFTLVLMALFCGTAFADEVTMAYPGGSTTNMAADGSNEAASVGLDASAWSVTADKGKASNAPGLNQAGEIRLYYNASGSNTITVSSLTNATITSIVITFTEDKYSNATITVNGNAVTGTEGNYDINSTSFVIGNGNTSNVQVRISKIVITYTAGGSTTTLKVPTLSVPAGTYYEPQTVALSSEDGVDILYTIPAGEDPVYTDAENYTGVFYDGTPLNITQTTTIKAMAVDKKTGKTSSIVTAKYVIVQVIESSVAEALAVINNLADGETTTDEYIVKGYVVGTPDFQRNSGNNNELYGNVNFTMADEKGGTTTLTIFRAKDFDNQNFTEETITRIKEGDEVEVRGQLQKYVKNETVTPELKNCYLVKVNGATTGIATAKTAAKQNGAMYNMAGQMVNKGYKGLIIMNGKKFFNK